jgi:hypothetical protein
MATLPTGGFARATVMPDPGLVDPRLLAADYTGIVRGANEGLQLAGNFSRLQDAAIARADAAALRDPRLAAERAQLELAPRMAQNQLALSNVARIRAENTPLELAETFNVGEVVRRAPDGSEYATPDVMLNRTVIEVDPLTGERREATRAVRPLSTIEQQAQSEAQMLAREELNDIRRAQMEANAANSASLQQFRADQQSERERAAAERERLANENLQLRQTAEQRLTRQGDERIDAASAAREAPLRQMTQMGSIRVPTGESLADYMERTRDNTGAVRTEKDARWYLPSGLESDVPVQLNPQAEQMVQQYQQIAARVAGPLAAAGTQQPTILEPTKLQSGPNMPEPQGSPPQYPTLSPMEAAKLPSGSFFYGTDGKLRRKP